jgi:DNA (cytosine-5)-methyltransferase 1
VEAALKIGSLCTGYGGLDLAVKNTLGGELIWYAENDKYPAKLLAHRFPEIPNLGDITELDWAQVEPVDVLTGGYPCQPFSRAGKREGEKDQRHLWPHIRQAIRILRPRYSIFENVGGHRSLGFGTVLRDCAEDGLDVRWCSVRASDVGAPHQRERLFFIVTDPDRSERQKQGFGFTSRQEIPAHNLSNNTLSVC